MVLADGEAIGVDEFPQVTMQSGGDVSPEATPMIEPSPATAASLPDSPDDAALTMPEHCLRLIDASGDVRPLEEIESEIIRFRNNFV